MRWENLLDITLDRKIDNYTLVLTNQKQSDPELVPVRLRVNQRTPIILKNRVQISRRPLHDLRW